MIACTDEASGRLGNCAPLRDCPEAIKKFRVHRIQPTFCVGGYRTICCPFPIQSRSFTKRISQLSQFYKIRKQ